MAITDTILQVVNIRPGINKNTTDYAAEGEWVDCDKMRFVQGRPEKIGGWVREVVSQAGNGSSNNFSGPCRNIHTWTGLDGTKLLAAGSFSKLELLFNNQIFNITPYRTVESLNNAITTVETESLVTITDSSHGAQEGDFITISGQETAVDGITLNGEYQIIEVTDANTYVIDSGVVATGSSADAGGDIDIAYQLSVGSADNGDLTGYGGGSWNTPGQDDQGYNRPRAGEGGLDMRHWSLDNWGENLMASPSGGGIYEWVKANGASTVAQIVPNAPTQNNIILVAQPSRFLVAFGTQSIIGGTYDPLLVRWADQETRTVWDQTLENSAGEYRLPLGNKIVAVQQTRSEILIFTDTAVYSMRYTGSASDPFRFDILGTTSNIAGPNASVDVNGLVMWMGTNSFYVYDGVIRTLPSTLTKFIFDQDGEGLLNFSQKEKTFCATNKEFSEVFWFYPSNSSSENDRYIVYNYLENIWYLGTFDRTCWADKDVFDKPFSISADGSLYQHETGYSDDGSPFLCFIESGFFDLGDGTEFMFLDKIVPDFVITPDRSMQISLRYRKYPNGSEFQKGPFTVSPTTRKINTRIRGRQVGLRYSMSTTGGKFQVGAVRFGLKPDGRR